MAWKNTKKMVVLLFLAASLGMGIQIIMSEFKEIWVYYYDLEWWKELILIFLSN